MQTLSLPHTNLRVSRQCFGTMTIGGQADEPSGIAMVHHCLDHGINFIDTANVYNAGRSEEIVGKALKGRRDKAILATKVRGKMGDGPDDVGLSPAAIYKQIDASLRRLQTDYVDLYYLHQPDYDVPLEDTLGAMEELVRQGKVRYPASSNYAAWQVCRMQWLAEEHKYRPVHATQPMYNVLARGIEQEYLPMAKELGVSTVVYNPLAGGLLTGKQSHEKPQPGTRFDNNQMYLDRYWHRAYFDAVDSLRGAAERAGRSLVSVALNWLLHHSQADCVILGASRMQQLQENLRAADEGPLSPELLEACDSAWAGLRGITPKYNR